MNKLITTTALVLTLAASGAGFAYADQGGPGKARHGFMEQALSKLPAADAAKFRDTLKSARKADPADREQAKKLHEELRGIVTAEKFDKAAYIAKSNEMQKLMEKRHEQRTEAFATALSQLPQNERKTLADAMQDRHRRGGMDGAPATESAPQ